MQKLPEPKLVSKIERLDIVSGAVRADVCVLVPVQIRGREMFHNVTISAVCECASDDTLDQIEARLLDAAKTACSGAEAVLTAKAKS